MKIKTLKAFLLLYIIFFSDATMNVNGRRRRQRRNVQSIGLLEEVSSDVPSSQPSVIPSIHPSLKPSMRLSLDPSLQPSRKPSSRPSTNAPHTNSPSNKPSTSPTVSFSPTISISPSSPPTSSSKPTLSSSPTTTVRPSILPSTVPSISPSNNPSIQPSLSKNPSAIPSDIPSKVPYIVPSVNPSLSMQPSQTPIESPSVDPTLSPSYNPSVSSQPSMKLSESPSNQPSVSISPSLQPSWAPSSIPSSSPSYSLKSDTIAYIEMILKGIEIELTSSVSQDYWRRITSEHVQTFWQNNNSNQQNMTQFESVKTHIETQDLIIEKSTRNLKYGRSSLNELSLRIVYYQEFEYRDSPNFTIPIYAAIGPFDNSNDRDQYIKSLQDGDSDTPIQVQDIFKPLFSIQVATDVDPQSPSLSPIVNFQPSMAPSIPGATKPSSSINSKNLVIVVCVLVCIIALMIAMIIWFLFANNDNCDSRGCHNFWWKKYNPEVTEEPNAEGDFSSMIPIKTPSINKDNDNIDNDRDKNDDVIENPVQNENDDSIDSHLLSIDSSQQSQISQDFNDPHLVIPHREIETNSELDVENTDPTRVLTGTGDFSNVHMMMTVSDIDDIDYSI
mmetsp:Transcript_22561/g.27669  ORF Transcript_22561/g.27669 Transcript_22561/m.27669 type:complete len:613 (+) Transcript_22561:180-2018(+)